MKKIILITSIIVVCICGIIITKNIIDIKNKNYIEVVENINDEEELEWWIEESKRREEIIEKEYVSEEMIIELTKSKPNWSKIDISDESLRKIKENYPQGIFNGEQYDNVKLKEDYNSLVHDTDMGGDTFVLVAKKDKIVDEYIVCGEIGSVLLKNRFGIYTIIKNRIFDENGNRIKYAMDEEHWIENMQKIALQDDEEVGKSEDFYERYPNFTGILNPYNEERRDITIKTLLEQCNFENKEYVCEVYYCNRYIYVTYKINYIVDNNNFIETFSIEELSSREYEWNDYNKLLNSTGIAIKVLLKNRDMNKMPFTKKLINSINDGLIDYDIVSFRRIKYENGQKNNKNLYKIVLTNSEVKYIGLKYKLINNKIDEIEITELPITEETFKNYTTKELYEMF